ncbi:hypothetical protein F9C28_04930 [Shimwellia pseudoproteus]|uniref:hypothetical protein n=1 Tax=Shimwellia pseudoproteus TaxID=570012 RepID=UPI0018EBA4D5|nr:hypothetical protein [Shimwellia pseudoproteus]MBJ3814287.1 hypothetical protein [Shimwellia pseudoproteus]
MTIIKISSVRHIIWRMAVVSLCLPVSHPLFAWPQEYRGEDSAGNTQARYTWDSDHQPNYNDILAKRLNASATDPGAAGLFLGGSSAIVAQETTTMGVGWNIPLYGTVTTGPVVSLQRDNSSQNWDDLSSATGVVIDPLQRASISTVGWRVNYPLGAIKSWAKISYNHQYGENVWRAQPGMSTVTASGQESSWKDIALGADMSLYHNVAAWASLSQSDGTTYGDGYMYNLGVSASF